MNEFEYIANHLSPLAIDGALSNDAFVYEDTTVITKDLIIENVHFSSNTPPFQIAQKALRVNLSDIAAMGAIPYGYFLGLAINNPNEKWLTEFTQGLAQENNLYNMRLLGGDTTAHQEANMISITMLGKLQEKCLTRSGAQAGEALYVSGTIGDAAIGLLTYHHDKISHYKILQQRYKVPEPPVNLGVEISNIASSAIDISDGFLQDANHLAQSSQVGLDIYLENIPFSQEVREIINNDQKYLEHALTGGDDYQLLFTAPSNFHHTNVTKIGVVTNNNQVNLLDKNNNRVVYKNQGYQHF